MWKHKSDALIEVYVQAEQSELSTEVKDAKPNREPASRASTLPLELASISDEFLVNPVENHAF